MTSKDAYRDFAAALRKIAEGTGDLDEIELETIRSASVEFEGLSLPDRFNDLDPDVPGYEPLRRVTDLAYNQSARGKGKERHNKAGKPFLQQPIMEIGRMVGVGYQTGQIMKKVQEATTMHQRGNHEGAKAELLGAIVYSAAAYMLVAELEAKET